jgi:natural product biosynthesis luciferase-like monooxygenase protein/amino acid adenylation domain-containing protein
LALDVAVLTRIASDGRQFRVAYVVPEPSVPPERVRRAVHALAVTNADPLPLLVSVVTAIPRNRLGEPDEAELRRLPVPESADPHPVPAPGPVPGRLHLGDVLDLPAPWAAGPVPGLPGAATASGPSSRCGGEPLELRDGDPPTLVDALLATAESAPDKGVHLPHDRFLSYPDLLDAARRTLTGLRSAGLRAGDPVILHSPALAEHLIALWACLLGGFRPVAVAQSPGYDTRTAVLDKLEHAWRDLGEPVVLSGGDTVAGLRGHAAREGLTGLRVVDLAGLPVTAEPAAAVHRPAPGDVAMLQLSSGSTGRSKIIQITHRGLIRYVQGARQAGRMDTGDVFVNWLPLDHVAGVVMYHFGPVVLGCDNVHVPTAAVLADPLLWLDLLHDFGAQHSWAPNFGYALVADALATRRPRRDWDLRGLRALVNAGEQCTVPVMSRFLDAVRPHGVEAGTVLLAWGMAETCTTITYQPYGPDAVQHVRQAGPGQPLELLDAPAADATTFLSMGPPAPGAEFRIAGPDGMTELPALHIGRLQGRSDRITPGYLNNQDANAEAFPDGEWFDTGDLAFVAGGRVTITGRAKEIIIVNGVHYYCHEIEDVVGELAGVARSFVAAFGVPGQDGIERLAVVFVPDPALSGAVVGGIRRRLSERFGLASVLLVAVDGDAFDKTTSGKIQRTAMRDRLLRGAFDRELRAVELAEAGPNTMPDCFYRPQWTPYAFQADRAPCPVLLVTDHPELGRALPDATVVPVRDWRAALTRAPARIVLAQGYTEPTESTVDELVDACSSDVLALTGALAAGGWTGELVTLGRGRYAVTGDEPGCYPAALAEAIGEVFALERPGVRAWHLDLPGGDRDPELLAEALTWSHRENTVAWRDVPMVRELTAVRPRPGPTAPAPGSCWLVTGGLGGIGRTVLAGLGLRLLVVGRGTGRDLDELGADVRYASMDIADGAALEAAVAEAEQAWGAALSGALHLAGHYELTQLADTPVTRWREQARAKVEGTLSVARVLRRRPGSRLVAFSSLLSWFPVVGSSAYVAGNRFLEAVCDHLDVPVHCLVWGLWRGVGINAVHDYSEAANRGRLLAFSPAEGRALLSAAVRQPPGTLLIGVDPNEPRARRMLPARALEGVRAPGRDVFGVEPPVGVAPAPPVTTSVGTEGIGVRRVVRDTLRQVMPGGIPADTPFYEAGIGSLELLRLHTLLRESLGQEFPLTVLFSHPTESALVRHLSAQAGSRAEPRHGGPGRDRRIAIIGMAARFPGADTLDEYWHNLLTGTVSTSRFGRRELLAAGLPQSLVDDPAFVPVSGALADIAGFDAELFGMSPGEAALTDPQHRLFLQICHEALEHGGYAGTSRRVGVYAGSGMNLYSLRTYLRSQLADADPGDQLTALQVTIGNEPDFLASRVSYRLGLTGPAVAVRSACSTSLVAVHTAVTALLAGDAELALAGAAALHVPRVAGYRYQEGSILSRSGVCRAFDQDADGTVGGNGVAAVLLKPLAAALADGDTVHAVILGSAVNNDGSTKVGYTSPSVPGQTEVLRDALTTAGVTPESIGYVEAHGTGTPIGDPIEVEALRSVFGGRPAPLLVGSVKPNIGHLDSCAGMAGLLKAVLALRHGTVPPQANLRTPNPAFRLADGPIELPTVAHPWPVPGPRRAGVTALGVGGTNAHVVLEQPPASQEQRAAPAPPKKTGKKAGPSLVRAGTTRAVTAPATPAARTPTGMAETIPVAPATTSEITEPTDATPQTTSIVATSTSTTPDTTNQPTEPTTTILHHSDGGATPVGAGFGAGGGAAPPLPWVVPLSARGSVALGELAGRMAEAVAAGGLSAGDVLTTLGAGRRRLPQRLVAWGGGAGEVGAALRAGGSVRGVAGDPGPLVFAFAGQGVDCAGAATSLMGYPEAAGVLRRCLDQYRAVWGVDLLEPLLGAPFEWTTATAQPALLALQLAQVALLDRLGVRPDLVIGHSAGEYAALCVAGALSTEDAMHLASVRGVLLQRVGAGAMVAVFSDVRELPGLEIAVRNGPGHVVFAGPPDAVAAAEVELGRRGIDCRQLAADRAFHTSAVEPVLDELVRQAAGLDWRPLRVPVVSGDGAVLPAGSVPGAEHVRRHTRDTADYHAGVEALVAQGCGTFVELGPSGVLTALGRQWPDTTWVPLRRNGADTVIPGLARLYCHGVEVDWAALGSGRRVPLPTYPFQLTPHWAGELTKEADPVSDDDTVLTRIRELTARHLGDEPDRIGADVPFFDLGADSLLMINMVRELEVAFGVRVSMRELFEEVDTPARLSAVITERMAPARRAAVTEAAAVPETPAPLAGAEPTAAPPASGYDAIVREQLDLMGRFTQLMSEQLTVLGGARPTTTSPPPPPPQPTQLGPRPMAGRSSGMTAGRLDERQRAHLDDLVQRYTARTARSKEIAQRSRPRLADSRAVVGFRGVTKEMLYPIAARRAKGAYLEDVDGNTYVDITMGFGILLFGHEPAFVADAVRDYLADGMRLGPRGPEAGEAAALLCELTGLDRAAFATSGTEANSAAFRLARAHTGRTMIVTFDGSYHGHFDPVLGRGVPDGDRLRTVPVSPGVPDSAVSETIVLPYGDEASLDAIRRQADRIAAVVLEPVPSRHPDRQPAEFVRALRELCDRHGIVLMFDEMLTGFRPHPQGAQGFFGVRADLATYGKVIGGGYPIGAIAGRADIMDWVDGGFWSYGDDSVPPGDTTFFGGTYIQHPVSMVAAKAVLTWLRDQSPGLQQNLNARTERLANTLNDFFAAEEFPVALHHFGSLFRFAHKGNLELLFHHLVMEGVHVWEWRNFFLSTAHTDTDVDFVADAVRNSLYDLRRGGFLPGRPAPAPAPRATLPHISDKDTAEIAQSTPDLSLYFFGDYPRDRDGDKYAAILAAARYADQSGLHAVWLPERHFDSFGGVFPNPSVLAAAIAAQTSRVRIHSGSVVLPLHDPIRVAEEWSVVDNLSGGRVSLGVASGWHARDFVLAPDVYGRHREAMYDGVETIRALWRGESVTRTAGNGEQVDVQLYPRPVQDEPEFYTAIVGNPDSYRQAAEAGFGVITNLMAQTVEQLTENITLYRRTRAEHGLDPAAGRVVLLLHTYLGQDTTQVRAEAYGPFRDYLRSSLALFGQVTNSLGFSIDLENTEEEDLDYLLSRAYERYCADRALIGSPADCEPVVRRLAGLGVDEIACFIDFGLPPARITAGLPEIGRLRAAFAGGSTMDLTPTERQIWYLETVFPNRPTYNETVVVRLDGELDVPALRRAVNTVVARHDGLRSVFREIDGEPRRVVSGSRQVELPVVEDGGDDAAARIVAAEAGHAFDLAAGPLFEPRLVRLGDRSHLLVLRLHHLVVDTWSAGILTAEISACYRAAVTGGEPALDEPAPLPPVRPVPADALAYWTGLLAGAPRELSLPTDRPRPAEPSGRGGTTGLVLDETVTARLRELARRTRVTPFMVLFAGYAAALRRLSGQTDLVIGTPFAHRPDGAEHAVGFFVNTLPVRVAAPGDTSFTDLVLAVREQLLGAQEHREVPFPAIVRALGGPADPLRNPLFDVVVEFDNEAAFELDLPGVRATLLDATVDRAPVDLVLFLTNLGDTIRCRQNHAVDLFDPATARRILDTFGQVLAAGLAEPDRPLGELPRDEAARLAEWQDGGPAPGAPALLHAGLSDVDNAAVVDGDSTVSRHELYGRAAAVTAALAELGATGGEPVAVHLPRSADAVAAMLGVLRAGSHYVPLDPEQPPARLAVMIDEAKATVVLTHSTLTGALPDGVRTVLVDQLLSGEAPVPTPAEHDVAYVLFTSGSTGVPKGCVIEHRAIANTLAWFVRDLEITAADRLCWFSSPGFDASCIEVWPALRTGATLHVVPPELRLDPARLRDWLAHNGITVTFVPTPVCELLLDLDWPADVALRHLVTGGDRLRRRPPASAPFTVWNVYGPTEAAVVSTWTAVPAHGDGPPTIGRPVPGTWVRVLDESGRQAPVGVAGELHLGGAQLARGYVNAPAETAARFVGSGGDRLYRTGDVVRWRADGELEFLRRDDSQVQIRGHRVEPGEIELALRDLPGVRDAAVRGFTGDDTPWLAAYVVPAADVTVEALRAALGARLPEYMVPAAWTILPELPLNASGKLDRAALPAPERTAADTVAPATETERRLHDVWCAELGLAAASVEATFFELGGHSLTAIRVVNRIRTELGTALGVLDFLRSPTIRRLAARLDGDRPVLDTAPATRAQVHSYWLTRHGDTPSVLTIAVRFALRGRLDQDALRAALTALTTRHGALRTRYRRTGDELWQEVLAPRPVALPVIPVREDELDTAVLDRAVRPFDLDHEPAFRPVLFTVAPERAELLLAMHHGVSDGWSMDVLVRDLGELYRAAMTGAEPDLPDLPADYLGFTRWEQRHLTDPATVAAVEAWAARARGAGAEPLLLPTDRPRPDRPSRAGTVLTTALPDELAARVTSAATERHTTPFAVLLAAFAAFVHELTGVAVAAPHCGVANRTDVRFENVVGLFTNSAWLMVPVSGAASFDELVTRATSAVHERLELQSVSGADLNTALGGPFGGSPPRVLVGLFTASVPALELPGLAPAVGVDMDLPVARADLSWRFVPTDGGGLRLRVEYATELFDAGTIEAWTGAYLALLSRSLSAPHTRTW